MKEAIAKEEHRKIELVSPRVGCRHTRGNLFCSSQDESIPVSRMTTGEKTRLLRLEDELNAKVIGQEQAISSVSDAIYEAKWSRKAWKAHGSFLMVGPTGTVRQSLPEASLLTSLTTRSI